MASFAACPAIGRTPSLGWAGSTASTPPESQESWALSRSLRWPLSGRSLYVAPGRRGDSRPRGEANASMAGLSIGERAKLSLLLLRRTLRSIAGRLRGHPFVRLTFIPRKAERLLIAPQDLRTADGTRASEIYAGRFAFAGKVVISDGRSSFQIVPPSDEWAAILLGFGWLRHLRAAESGITRANARALVDEWIAVQGAYHPIGWQPQIMARRIVSWLSHAPLILHDAD